MKKVVCSVVLPWRDAEKLVEHFLRCCKFGTWDLKSGPDTNPFDVFSKRTVVIYDENTGRIAEMWCEQWKRASKKGLEYCPFCGGIVEVVHGHPFSGKESYQTARVRCTECGCATPSVIIDGYYGAETTEQDAINKWNKRA